MARRKVRPSDSNSALFRPSQGNPVAASSVYTGISLPRNHVHMSTFSSSHTAAFRQLFHRQRNKLRGILHVDPQQLVLKCN